MFERTNKASYTLTVRFHNLLDRFDRLRRQQRHMSITILREERAQHIQILLSHHVVRHQHAASFQRCHSLRPSIPTLCHNLQRLLLRLRRHQLRLRVSLRTQNHRGTPALRVEHLLPLEPRESLTVATLPRLMITSCIRSPSARSTSERRIRSLLIWFSIALFRSDGGSMFWISTRVTVTPQRSASRWI